MLDKGISPHSIARFAKIVGYETALNVLYHLEEPSASYEGFRDDPEELVWGLFQVDPETGEPIKRTIGTYESLLSMDPSGREMVPKNS